MSQNQRESSSSCGSVVLSPTSSASAPDWLNSPSAPESPMLIAPNEYRNSAQHVILVKQETESVGFISSPEQHYTSLASSPNGSFASSNTWDDSDGSGSELVLARGSPLKRRRTDSVEEIVRIYAPPRLFDDVTLKAIHFYKAKTIHQIGSFFTLPLWEQLPKIAQAESSIRHAMIALSRFHERFCTSTTPQPALMYYNMAIKDLQNGIPTTTAILCLMLFYAIELLQTSHLSAIKLFRVARRMLHDATPDSSELYLALSAVIRRLDYQVKELCGEVDPSLPYDTVWGSQPVKYLVEGKNDFVPIETFHTFQEAMGEISTIIRRYRNDPNKDHNACLAQIAQWQATLDRSNELGTLDSVTPQRKVVLGITWRSCKLMVSKDRDAPVSTMWWDQWEQHFDEYLDLQEKMPIHVLQNTFGLETCELSELFKLGCDCRSPRIRRRVLARMSFLQMQEGILCSKDAVQVLQRVIEIEERGTNPTSSSEIPEEHRLSEVKFDFNGDRVRIRYTLNSTVHTEDLEDGARLEYC